jgi:hypothetical protein
MANRRTDLVLLSRAAPSRSSMSVIGPDNAALTGGAL